MRKCCPSVVLSRPRRQFLQKLTGGHPAREHRCNAAQHIRPVGDDGTFPDFVAHQTPQLSRYTAPIKDMQPFGGQIPDARDEQIAKQLSRSEHKIDETACIGVLFFDPLSGRVH